MSLTSDLLAYALSIGFDRAAVLPVSPPRYGAQFAAWLEAGYHGEMSYLAARAAERLDPARWVSGTTSMIVATVNYHPGFSPQSPGNPSQGRIARYALWPDYHEALKPKLYALDAFIRQQTGRQTLGKVFVDSAPVLERDFAEQAGLGFIGRNTCLITPGLGSWTFLAGLLAPENLTPGWRSLLRDPSLARGGELTSSLPDGEEGRGGRLPRAERGWEVQCGRCTRCLDACPTQAFAAPHVLDARRCISYLTIELRGPIPRELRPLMGNWVFGCDVCQEVCPYNRGSSPTVETAAASAKSTCVDSQPVGAGRLRNGGRDFQLSGNQPLSELLTLDEAGFRTRFRGTPVLRAKRRGLVRNACVAAGNSGDAMFVPQLSALLTDPEPLVRGHAAWALGQIGGANAHRAVAQALEAEPDPWVRAEMTLSIACTGE